MCAAFYFYSQQEKFENKKTNLGQYFLRPMLCKHDVDRC